MDDLRNLVLELADARYRCDEARAECVRREAAFKLANETIFLAAEQAKQERDDLEGEIRARTYSAEERAPAPGLSVKMVTKMTYFPEDAATWAIEHKHYKLLTINARAFEKVAAGLRPEFVIITEVPTVTIARDLTEATAQIGAERAAEAARETAAPKDIGTAIEELVEGVAAMIEADTAVELLRAAGLGPCTEALVGIQDVIGFFDKAVEVVAP